MPAGCWGVGQGAGPRAARRAGGSPAGNAQGPAERCGRPLRPPGGALVPQPPQVRGWKHNSILVRAEMKRPSTLGTVTVAR